MNILITGATGFIGKNLAEQLSSKYTLLTPNHHELDLINSEEVNKYFSAHSVDVVIHTATINDTRKNEGNSDVVKNNLLMFFNLANNSKRYKKMIFLGSGAEYDKRQNISNVKESDFGKNVPSDDYGFYKYACSKYIEKSENIIGLRLFGVFGKYEDYEIRFISNILCRIIFNLPVEINQNMHLDYADVKDVCGIIKYFIENKAKHKFYNVGTGERIDLLSLAKKIKKVTKKDFSIAVKKTGMNKEYTCDNSLLKKDTNFNFTPLDASIKELYEWYLSNMNEVNKENLLRYL
jgi:UDP-glucose 4-epimerase